MNKDFFTASECSRLINEPLSRVLRHIENTKFPARRLGRTFLLTEADINALASELAGLPHRSRPMSSSSMISAPQA